MKNVSKVKLFNQYLFNNLTSPGITLMELLVSLVIVGMIGIALAAFLSRGVDVWIDREREADISNKARVAVDRITRELKHTIKNSITLANSSEVEFKIDLDNDGEAEKVKYDVSGTNLRRIQDGGTAYTIANDVNSLAFKYYNSSGSEFTPTTQSQRNNIRYIKVTLNMKENVSVTSRVYLKNFRRY